MGLLRAMYWEIKMDIVSTWRYKFGVISDIIVFSVLLSFFLFTNTGQSYTSTYGYENYKELLILGYLAWMYAIAAISTMSQIISGELRQGTFYKKYNSKYPLQLLMFARLVASLLIETIVTIILILLAKIIWNVNFKIHPIIVLSILISTLGMYGIGLIVSGLAIFYKNIGSVIFLIQLGLLFITDTLPSNTNNMLTIFTKVLPLTSCNAVIKLSLSGKYYTNEFILMVFTSILFIVLGMGCFKLFLKKSRKKGNLLFY